MFLQKNWMPYRIFCNVIKAAMKVELSTQLLGFTNNTFCYVHYTYSLLQLKHNSLISTKDKKQVKKRTPQIMRYQTKHRTPQIRKKFRRVRVIEGQTSETAQQCQVYTVTRLILDRWTGCITSLMGQGVYITSLVGQGV